VKGSEARELTNEEIAVRLRDARDALFNLRFQHAQGVLERTSEMRVRRREIAQLLTVAREREIAAEREAV
jgi:large subunit ribosomal protein L29